MFGRQTIWQNRNAVDEGVPRVCVERGVLGTISALSRCGRGNRRGFEAELDDRGEEREDRREKGEASAGDPP